MPSEIRIFCSSVGFQTFSSFGCSFLTFTEKIRASGLFVCQLIVHSNLVKRVFFFKKKTKIKNFFIFNFGQSQIAGVKINRFKSYLLFWQFCFYCFFSAKKQAVGLCLSVLARRAMELTFSLMNPSNIRTLMKEMMSFLEYGADAEFKFYITSNIFLCAEK